jgi:hypothetical protein
MWARMAKLATEKVTSAAGNTVAYNSKVILARYWMERMVPECPMLLERIQAGSDTIMAYEPRAI